MLSAVPSRLNSTKERSDLELLAVWELKNMGLGTAFERRNALDSYTQAVTKYNQSQFQLIRAVGRVPVK